MTYLFDALQARAGEFISLRRDIHRHPELAFEEHRTAALVADKLEAWGFEVERSIGGTGVVGTLVRGQSKKRLGIRADMDALPIDEASGAEWSSVHSGVMHACGHDGHTAMLLAAARHLAEQGSFDGTLHLIFQPAEEGGGGALRMMEDGLFERFPCDAKGDLTPLERQMVRNLLHFSEHDADDLVERIAIDRHPAVAVFGERGDQFGEAGRSRDGDDLAARDGHVVGVVLAEMEQVADHLAFERGQVALGVAGIVLMLVDRFLELRAQRLVAIAAPEQRGLERAP